MWHVNVLSKKIAASNNPKTYNIQRLNHPNNIATVKLLENGTQLGIHENEKKGSMLTYLKIW